jgi:hypothetical protein
MRRDFAQRTRTSQHRGCLRSRVVRGSVAGVLAASIVSGLSVLPVTQASPAGAATPMPSLSFAAPQFVSGTTDIVGVACPSASICQTVSSTPAATVAVTSGTPAAAQAVTGPNSMIAVACSSVTFCDALGNWNPGTLAGEQAVVIPVSGGVPGTQIPLAASSEFERVACPSLSGAACVAVGNTYVPGGSYTASAWSLGSDGTPGAAQGISGLDFLYGIGCPPGSDACMATGFGLTVDGVYSPSAVVVPITNGVPGTPTTIPGGLSGISAVACPTTTTCYAVGYLNGSSSTSGAVVTITNGVPSSAQTVSGTGTLTGIACPTPDTCLALGGISGGTAVVPIVDGTVGTVQTDTGPSLQDIDCPSANQCEAGGAESNGSSYEGVVDQINIVPNQLTISSLTLDPSHPTVSDPSVTATLTVRDDYATAVTDVVPTLSSSNPSALAIASGPSPTSQATLDPGDSATFTYQLTPKQATTVQLQPGATALDQSSATVTAPAVPPLQVDLTAGDLTVTLAASPSSTVTTGASTTITATATNATADTLTALTPTLTSSPSAGLNIGSPTPANLATLAPHAQTTFSWPVTTIDPGTFSLTASIQVTDPNTGVETDDGTTPLTVSNTAIVVTTTGDEDDPAQALTDGICDVDPNTDGNQCTLRAAIELANSLGGTQSITFDIPGGGVPDIAPASALPTLQASISIDGTTQPGGWVQLSGASEGGTAPGLSVGGGTAVIRGLVIDGWAHFGGVFVLGGSGTLIAGNRIGTDPSGTSAVPNGYGVYVQAPNVTIGGISGTSLSGCTGDCNLISGNDDGTDGSSASGVYIHSGGSATVVGNYIGTDVTGENALGNAFGIVDASTDGTDTTVIGGPTSVTGGAPGNLISGNRQDGLSLDGIDTVQGNLIGEDRSGSRSLQPVAALNPPNQPGGTNLGIGILSGSGAVVKVGGTVAADRNVIGGFGNVGVFGATTVDNDEIGTNPAGTAAIANGVGTDQVGSVVDSLVSGNSAIGIESTATAVAGDRVGTSADGQSALPNLVGVEGAGQVGGDRPAGSTVCTDPCNLISGNLGAGVDLASSVEGNFIGTNLAGTDAIPNGLNGPQGRGPAVSEVDEVGGPSGVVARGVCDQACNLISGNDGAGVQIGAVSEGMHVQGNLIGDSIGLAPLGNQQAGVFSQSGEGGDLVGGDGDLGNVISHNIGAAVEVGFQSVVPAVEANAMIANAGGIVIDQGFGGSVPKSPLIATAVRTPGQVAVTGDVSDLITSGALSSRIDLYASASCSEGPQGQVPLGNVSIGLTSNGSFAVTAGAVAQSLPYVLATSTESGATSPFTNCFPITTASTTSPQVGQPVTVQSAGFTPGEQVSVTLHSTPVLLETVTSDGDGDVDTTVTIPSGTAPGPHELILTGLSSGYVVTIPITVEPVTAGYRVVGADGGIFSFGDAGFFGSEGGTHLNSPTVGMAATPDGGGYWLVAADGGVFSFGDAVFHGSEGGKPLNSAIVGMAATPDGSGYWLVAADGGVFSFGDAGFFGSEGGKSLNSTIVGMAATSDGGGYWLVAADGGVFSFGDAVFHGSEGGKSLNSRVAGMAATPDGGGYWLVASDGGVFSFGDAVFHGSEGGKSLNSRVVGMAATPDGGGYWLVASDGGVFSFGDAGFFGSEGGKPLNSPVVGMAAPANTSRTSQASEESGRTY